MKLSIIMPCFNVSNTLARALDSIIMQEVNFEYEVIIVDDASTDQTVKIAKQYSDKYSQIKIICNNSNKEMHMHIIQGFVYQKEIIFVY